MESNLGMDHVTISQFCAEIAVLLEEKLGAKKGSLARRAHKARRRLPKEVRAAIAVLVEADEKSQDPRIAMQVDPLTVTNAFTKTRDYLSRIDPKEERITRQYRFAALVMSQVIVVFVVFVVVMRQTGHL